jgi:adenine-specific DNA-methyltransferase
MPILHWLDRDQHTAAAEAVPYRLLEAVDAQSAGDPETPNMLIQGDNLEALKALLPYYAGRVKCIFIDPPYNTRSAFEHYDDNLEHSQWLAMMYPRLKLLSELLAKDGSLWVTIDDNEVHYLKVIMDEVFGRSNFLTGIVWEKTTSARNDAQFFSADQDYILLYAKNLPSFSVNRLDRTKSANKAYKNLDDDPRGPWREIDYKCAKTADERPNLFYPIKHPVTGKDVWPRRNRVWAYGQQEHARHQQEKLLWWGKTGNYTLPKLKKFISDAPPSSVPRTLWFAADVDQTRTAKKEMKELFPEEPFTTPKPERLLQRIIHLATKPGDLVLDSFLGSGTTAAVAHKMGRRYIGIEMGDHALTHCAPRLRKVIDGEQGGISQVVNWKGGGGFRFYQLGAEVFDSDGQINSNIRFVHLAAHVWFSETHSALHKKARGPLLGVHNGVALYLLYNGILGDKRPEGGNVLTARTLAMLPKYEGQKIIYGEACRLGNQRLKELSIIFKQTPYEIKAR